MQVPDFPEVYAVGDSARYKYHLTGESVRVEHWNVAQNQGRLVAKNIVSGQALQSFTQVRFVLRFSQIFCIAHFSNMYRFPISGSPFALLY